MQDRYGFLSACTLSPSRSLAIAWLRVCLGTAESSIAYAAFASVCLASFCLTPLAAAACRPFTRGVGWAQCLGSAATPASRRLVSSHCFFREISVAKQSENALLTYLVSLEHLIRDESESGHGSLKMRRSLTSRSMSRRRCARQENCRLHSCAFIYAACARPTGHTNCSIVARALCFEVMSTPLAQVVMVRMLLTA